MSHFNGTFFCCTRHSTYQIRVPADCISRPIVMKVATIPDGRELQVPVGGIFRYGVFIAITKKYLWQYSAHVEPSREHPAPQPSSIPPAILGAKKSMTQTGRIVGLFLRRGEADECHEANLQMYRTGIELAKPFDPRWLDKSRRTVAMIGNHHPWVCIANDQRWGIPENLLVPE